MRVELSPSRVEVTVGESVVLSCKATHDTSLDVAFQWFFNQRPIAFQHDGGGGGGHFEFIQTVRTRVKAKVRAREASSACLHVILKLHCVCVRVPLSVFVLHLQRKEKPPAHMSDMSSIEFSPALLHHSTACFSHRHTQ